MAVLNDLDRFHLAADVVAWFSHLGARGDRILSDLRATLRRHHDYMRLHGEDMPEIQDWRWAP
jgi:xylulose-5-phosphate/fructose-6-phosphate phosphoketolase